MSVTRLGNPDGIKKILITLNCSADDSFISKEWDNASVRIASIYREAGKTLPVTETADPNLWNLAEHLACYLVVKRLAHTLEGKMAADKDIKDATDQVYYHIGIVPGQQTDVSEAGVFVGPGMTSLGDSTADE